MNRLASIRVGAVFASVVMALAGCDCGKVDCTQTPTAPECTCDTTDLTASFTTPKDGDMVEQTSNVQVTLARRGAAVNVGSAKLQIRGPGATEFGTSRDGVTDGANATFSGVQLQPGENALRATVVEANCTNSVPAVTIVVTAKNNVTPPPVVLGCDFPQDANTDGVLNATELPAGQAVSVRVRTQNGAGATFSAPNSSPASAPIMNETATLTVPGPTADGTFAVTGTVTRGTGMPTCNASIRVQRVAGCAIENTTDQTVRGPMNDADSMTAGFQIRATASRTTGMAATATLRMGNESRPINLNSAATASADFTVASTGTQSYMVTLEGADSAGNPCTVVNATRTVSVDFEAPTVAITAPMAADGGALVTRAPVAVTASVGAADNGATACAFIGTTQVDCGTVANGSVTLSVPFGSDGPRTIEVRVTDAAGNTASARVDVNVVLSGCGVAFYVPPTSPALVNASQAPGGNYTVRTASKATCVGQPVRLSRAAVSADGGVGAFNQIGSGTLTLRALADGGNDAVSAFTSMVSNGDFVFRAEVDNFGDGGVDQSSVDVTVDLDGPVITSPVVPSGQMRANINTSQDSSATTPGAQRVLSFNARVPMGGRVDLCTTQNTGTTTPECGSGFFRLATNLVSPVTSFTYPEGSYDLKIVVVGGGNTIESPVVPVTVDVSRPCIVAATLRAPQDSNMDGRLNLAELGAAAPRLEFQLDSACGDSTLATLSSTAGVTVREVVGGVPTTTLNLPADVSFDGTAMRVRVNLTQSIATERDYTFFVELQDLLGNRNLYSATNNPAVLPIRVDRVAPLCDLVAPTLTTLNTSQVPSGTLTVTVATSADVGTNGVGVTLSGLPGANGTPSGASNQVSIPFNSLTGTNTRTLDVTCRDLSGNATPIPQRSLTIDLDAPTCAFTAPTASTSYTDLAIPTSLTVTGGDGRTVTISSTVGGTRGNLTTTAGVAAGSITYANGLQDLTASLTDAAGNSGTCQVAAVNVNSADCGLTITNAFSNSNGLWFNRSNTGSLTASSGTATVTAQTSSCTTGRMITLVRTAPTAGTPIVVADVAGTATFSAVALNDDETWSISVPNGARPPTVQTFRVDLDAPSFGVGPTQLGQARINGSLTPSASPTSFVAAADNRNVETAVAGYFADLTAGTPGAQANVVLDGVQAFDFSLNGTVTVLFKGSPVATQTVTAANQTISFSGGSVLTLPHNDSGALIVRVTDGAGNSSEWTSTATIDVLAPAAPSVSQTVAEARIAEAGLGWTPTYDDGSTVSSGGHAGYDVRWTTSSVPGGNNLATAADFFGSASNPEPNIAWSANPIVDRRVTLPPLNSYYIAVRARDEVGNYSPYTAPTALPNFWTEVTITAPAAAASANFAQTVVAAQLNSDTAADLVVTAPNRTGGGAVYVYYGAPGLGSQSTCGGGCQELTPSDATAGQFGSDVGVGGNIGDIAGENKTDLVVGQTWTGAAPNNGGRVVIYFGSASATVDGAQAIELRGDSTTRIGSGAVRIIPSIDGDALDELVISAPLYNAGQGRLLIYKGRSRAAWASARSSTDPVSMVPFIPVSTSTADYVVDGPTTLLSASGNALGQNRFGLLTVGDINADGRPDLAVPTSRASINKYRVFSGAAIAASTGGTPLAGTAFILEYSTATVANSSTLSGLGTSSAAVDVVDSSVADLVTSFPGAGGAGRIFVFSTPVAMAGAPAPTYEILGPLPFGTQLSLGRLNGATDIRTDIIGGTSLGSGNFAFAIYQQSGVRPFAGTGASILGTSPEFWVSRFDATVITANASSGLGAANTTGDVDGNGQVDVILGDRITGQVRIWR